METHIELIRYVDAPLSAVWQVLTDLEGSAERLSSVTRIERTSGSGFEPGTSWRETRKIFGAEASEDMTVVGLTAEREIRIEAQSHGMRYDTGFTLKPRGRGVLLTMVFHGEQQQEKSSGRIKRALGALTAPLGRRITRSMMHQDLRDVATAAEDRA